jgi:hypothetical protein
MVEMFASAADPQGERHRESLSSAEAIDPMPTRRGRIDRLHDRARRLFILSCYASLVSILCWALLILLEVQFPNSLVTRLGQFDTVGSTVLTLVFGAVAIAVPAITPFVSLFFMIMVLFKGTEFAGREIWLTSFALMSGALALMLSMTDTVCAGITTDTQACFALKWGFVFDQFSKGSLADFFDVFDFGFSSLDLGAMTGLTKLYVLNFRLLSAAYLVSVVLAIVGRWQKRRLRREIGERKM